MGSIRRRALRSQFACILQHRTYSDVLPDLSRPNFASLTNTASADPIRAGPRLLGAWDCKVSTIV